MTFNTETIIQEIRTEFEGILEFVTNEQAQASRADEIERGLFKRLLNLGLQLLQLFFILRAEQSSREPIAQGEKSLPYHSDKRRRYYSVFGRVFVWRPYFYQQGEAGQSPLDAELSLGDDIYSDMLREMAEHLGVYVTYLKDSDLWQRFFGLKLSTRAIQEQVITDAADVVAYYEQKSVPTAETEAAILVVQADGKGVPMVVEQVNKPKRRLGKGQKRGRKKEAIVTSVYTIAAKRRTPQQVLDSFFNPNAVKQETRGKSPPKPQNKQVWATLAGKDMALARLAKQVISRQGPHIQHRVALCDGCEALQNRIQKQFSEFTLILDFVHANEYLWQVARALLGETDPQRDLWVAEQTLQMLCGHTDHLIAHLRTLLQTKLLNASQHKTITKTANYFQRNLPYMDYQTYLKQGYPIASGVIEGACRHLVKDRFELSGMRWTYDGAEALLHLRAVAENDDWEDYHSFRKQRRHNHLYPTTSPQLHTAEIQALATQSITDLAQRQPISFSGINSYHSLPLAG
jgi:hypothetical protein